LSPAGRFATYVIGIYQPDVAARLGSACPFEPTRRDVGEGLALMATWIDMAHRDHFWSRAVAGH
jgi:hypothetical protein